MRVWTSPVLESSESSVDENLSVCLDAVLQLRSHVASDGVDRAPRPKTVCDPQHLVLDLVGLGTDDVIGTIGLELLSLLTPG